MRARNPARYLLAFGIPVLFLVGGLFHFLFHFCGKSPAAAIFFPVNESVFEHLKMVVWPTTVFWGLGFWRFRECVRLNAWFSAAFFALLTALLSIPLLFYFYTGATGREWFAVDMLLLLLSNAAGQLLGVHLLRKARGMDFRLAILLQSLILLLFALLTNFPPRLPLFQDPATHLYGILP